jgi:arginine-tRNA-protein transferase
VKKGYLAASFGVVAPVCQSCRACVPLRVNTDKFILSPSQEKMLARGNFTYGFTASVLLNPQELYNLFKKYTGERHNEKTSKMHDWSMEQFRNWLDFMPFAMTARDPDNFLRGFAAMEADKDSALLEYIVFDPELKKLSMGKRLWLQAMVDAQSSGIKHVYVGAWAKDSPKLAYKQHHSGLETFDGKKWVDFDPEVHTRGPNYRAMLKAEGFTL